MEPVSSLAARMRRNPAPRLYHAKLLLRPYAQCLCTALDLCGVSSALAPQTCSIDCHGYDAYRTCTCPHGHECYRTSPGWCRVRGGAAPGGGQRCRGCAGRCRLPGGDERVRASDERGDSARHCGSRGYPPMLTRTSRSLRTVRTGCAYQPLACRTYLRHRAACPQGATHGNSRTSLGHAARTAYRGTAGLLMPRSNGKTGFRGVTHVTGKKAR
eukprot:scaffold69759_cov51-Phaeocystis_antarctica.AAC.1